MSEEYLVRNCAPTLAGLKTGNMFTCPFESRDALLEQIRQLNRRLRHKGLRLLPLRFSETKALLYLFRPAKLQQDLSHGTAEEILRCQGYRTGDCGNCVGQLARKLRREEDFPHEVGLFLGYPPEDVRGFICQGPDCCKCTGCWKVYGDEEAARKKFAQFKHCTKVYCKHWSEKGDLDRLAVQGRIS